MSLREVSLDPFLLAGIYHQPLIEKDFVPVDSTDEKDIPVPSLGNNKRQWVLLIHNPEDAYLNEAVFDMLLKLLNACKLTLDDIALINTAHLQGVGLDLIRRKFSPDKMILFGDVLPELKKGYHKNEAWEEEGIDFLHTDALQDMYNHPQLKMPFWNALKDFLTI